MQKNTTKVKTQKALVVVAHVLLIYYYILCLFYVNVHVMFILLSILKRAFIKKILSKLYDIIICIITVVIR